MINICAMKNALFGFFLLLLLSLGNSQNVSYYTVLPQFASILGANPKVTVIAESDVPLFHEAGVYYPPTKSLFVSSDYFNSPEYNNNQSTILILHITGDLTSEANTNVQILNSTGIPLPNGGYRYLSSSNLLVWCGQGSPTKAGGIWFLNPLPPYNATQILKVYGNYPFNSPNDITVNPAGEIYFTDPIYGLEYGYRPAAYLPNQVYRFNPSTGEVRAVADGFSRPNAIAVNRDASIVYIADTGAQPGDGTIDTQGARTVYAFDVQRQPGANQTRGGFLGNRRLFAFPDVGGVKGIKVDTNGNIYLGIDDGVSVWNSAGDLVGKILIPGGIANLGFGEPGTLFALGDTKLWRIDISKDVVGSSFLI